MPAPPTPVRRSVYGSWRDTSGKPGIGERGYRNLKCLLRLDGWIERLRCLCCQRFSASRSCGPRACLHGRHVAAAPRDLIRGCNRNRPTNPSRTPYITGGIRTRQGIRVAGRWGHPPHQFKPCHRHARGEPDTRRACDNRAVAQPRIGVDWCHGEGVRLGRLRWSIGRTLPNGRCLAQRRQSSRWVQLGNCPWPFSLAVTG